MPPPTILLLPKFAVFKERPAPRSRPVRDRLFAEPRFQRALDHVVALGARPTGELLAEILDAEFVDPCALDRLLPWGKLDPDLVRALNGHRWPQHFAMLRGGRR